MTIPRWLAVVVLVLVASVSVGVTLLITSDNGRELPPGCAPEDRDRPGCRPTNTGSGSNTVALVTVILTPLAALAVGLVAAASARDRLREQLGAEAERLRKQLGAEAEREKARLDHERRLHDLDGLRELIDDAATAMQGRVLHVQAARRSLLDKIGPLDSETEDALHDAVGAAQDQRQETLAIAIRLLVHFDADSDLYSSYNAFMDLQDEQLGVLWQDDSLDAEERLSRSEDDALSAGEDFKVFRRAARRTVGYRLPED